jgi:hypothetical protein
MWISAFERPDARKLYAPTTQAPQQQQQQQQTSKSAQELKLLAAKTIIQALGRAVVTKHEQHTCNREYCHPVSELDLKNRGVLPGSYVPYNPSVYVCQLRSIHVCTADDCSLYTGTHNGTCPITGIYHGHTEGEKAYVMPEKRTATFRRTGLAKGMQSSTNLALQAQAQREHERGIQHILCEEEEEEEGDNEDDDAIRASSLNNVFGVLTTLTKKRTREQEIASTADASVVIDTSPAPPPDPVPTKKKIKYAQPTERTVQHLRDVAENIVQTLLYSKERVHLNAQKRKQLMEAKEQETRNYYHAVAVARRIPVMVDVLVLVAKYDMEAPYLNILRPNAKKVSHYVDVVVQTWFAITRSPWIQENPGFQFHTHAFCVLYMMRKGLNINGVVVIPKVRFMTNLPVRVDLPVFGKNFCSKVLTNGQKAIKAAFQSMYAHGMPEHTYMLNLEEGVFRKD